MPKAEPTQHASVSATFDPAVPFAPSGAADRELEWFFAQAESDLGVRSNYMTMIKHEGDPPIEDRVGAMTAYRTVTARLVALGDYDAGVLKAAYVTRVWPRALMGALGRATGVVVRLATAELGLPDDEDDLATLEHRTAEALDEALKLRGIEALAGHRAKALSLLQRAFRRYTLERGGKEVPCAWGGA